MSAALPSTATCCLPSCDDVTVQNIPGPTGAPGLDGADGTNGISSVTTLTGAYTMPGELAAAQATMVTTAGLVVGQPVYVQSLGTFSVASIDNAIQATLTNLKDTPTLSYLDNAAPGTIAPFGSKVGMTGFQGPAGLIGGTIAGGDLKGTYPDPDLSIPNNLGALVAGNGTDAVELAIGTGGQMLVSDSATFPTTGVGWSKPLPITGDTQVADNRVPRLNGATGKPIPLQSSKIEVNDNGAISAVGSGGSARGTDAVDLQVNRSGVDQVASGARSVIAGGQNNTAAGTECAIGGGEENICGAIGANHAAVAGGSGNTATGQESFIGGGQNNTASQTQSTVAGGDTNTASGEQSFIGGGGSNVSDGPNSAICGGFVNTTSIGKDSAFIGAGTNNTVNGDFSFIPGGQGNSITEKYCAAGGGYALADKHGQRAHAAGLFTTLGDCQQSDVIWRVSTTDATANVEAFLDGAVASKRATISTGRTVAFDILIVGRSSTGASAAWTVKGAIKNNAGTTSLVAVVTNALLADGTGATWGVIGNVPTVDADAGNNALRIRVTGAVATSIRWSMHGRLLEVGY